MAGQAIPTTRRRNGKVQGHQDPAEICLRAHLNPQPLQSGPPSKPSYHIQTEPLRRPGRVATTSGLNNSARRSSPADPGFSDTPAAELAYRLSRVTIDFSTTAVVNVSTPGEETTDIACGRARSDGLGVFGSRKCRTNHRLVRRTRVCGCHG